MMTMMMHRPMRWISLRFRINAVLACALLGVVGSIASTEVAAAEPITLDDAVERALEQHPTLRRDDAALRRRDIDVQTARTELLPEVDLSAELHRGTGNVVPGSQLPLAGVPTVAGPPAQYRFDGGVWGSGMALTVRYDVAAIATRMREVDRARADRQSVAAQRELDRLDVAVNVAASYLDAVEAKARHEAAASLVERADALVVQSEALVAADLQPGAELARARAELAAARSFAATTRAQQDVALARLAASVGTPEADLDVELELGPLPGPAATRPAAASHPALLVHDARLREAEARRRAAALGILPRVELVGAIWVRGSGFSYPRAFSAGDTGLVPDAGNWVIGVGVTWPLLDLPTALARHRASKEDVAVARAERDELELELDASVREAEVRRAGAREVAALGPEQVASARTALEQATARYDSGLGRFVDVAEGNRALAEAELTDLAARTDLARAELLAARAGGDLDPFFAHIAAGKRQKVDVP